MAQTETKHFICVNCPVGCDLEVTLEDGEAIRVEGNACKRGIAYGMAEATQPKRVVTSLVAVEGRRMPLSVRTADAVPKELIPACIAELRKVRVKPPVALNDVVCANICGTGVDVIATKEVL